MALRAALNHSLRNEGIHVVGEVTEPFTEILSPSALRFLAKLHRLFNARRIELLARREFVQKQIDQGHFPDFLPETTHVRESEWKGPPPAPGLVDRRVEITGPVDRKMVINALNSPVKTFMADFEDSNSPTWDNNLNGQINLRDALRRTISFTNPNGKEYKLNANPATLIVRPRGWHLDEDNLLIDGMPISGSLFDFGLYFYHNAHQAIKIGHGPYFYLPKMESHLEARLWNEVFNVSQYELGLPRGTIRATCLIETILAAFEMDEFIYELREHSAGLNCGRWDYVFSCIKRFRNHPEFVLPDRSQVTMTVPFMNAYVQLLIKTCHRRGVHAMGGMAAQIPIKNNEAANKAALDKVTADKLREVKAGHDGTWVAHPGLAKIAMDIFNEYMPTPNQIHAPLSKVQINAKDLYPITKGTITEAGIRGNIVVGLQYMEAWLQGTGCVPLNNLMEDAATAEICRSQLWQWIKHGAKTDSGKLITRDLIIQYLNEEIRKLPQGPKLQLARERFELTLDVNNYQDFLTLVCYNDIVAPKSNAKL